MQFAKLNKKPFRKYFAEHFFAIIYAQKIKMTNQKNGSKFDGIQNTVAIAIAKPIKESRKISFLFIICFLMINEFLKLTIEI
jgi:hypothetical protein